MAYFYKNYLMDKVKLDWLVDELVKYGVKIIVALLIMSIGFWLAGKLKTIIRNRMIKRGVDASVREFVIPVLDILFKMLVILTAISTVGVQVTSFAAILAGLAAGIGLSLQGSLSNFAGGLLIIFFKPFKVGDVIEASGKTGTVQAISILYTTLLTPKNNTVIIPNSALLNNPIENYSLQATRRVDINVGIAYSANFEKTQSLLKEMLQNEPLVVQDEPITVEIQEFAASSVNLTIRCFVKNDHYWDSYFKIYKETKRVLDENRITIPFPQSEMRIISGSDSTLEKPQ